MGGGGRCLDRLSEYHFKEAHDFYWQRSSQQHCQHHCLRHCFSKDPVDISFQVLYNRPSYSAGLGGNYAALPPPPHIKIISHRICANLRIDPKGRYKNGNPFKNGKLSSLFMRRLLDGATHSGLSPCSLAASRLQPAFRKSSATSTQPA